MVRATIRVRIMVLVNRDRNPSNTNFYLKLLFITDAQVEKGRSPTLLVLYYNYSTTGLLLY